MQKTKILATIVAGSALALAGFGCSHTDKDTTAPNQYSQPATPGTASPDMNQGSTEQAPGATQRQNVSGTDSSGVTTPNANPPADPVQKNNNLPANPDMNQGTNSMPQNGSPSPGGTAPVK